MEFKNPLKVKVKNQKHERVEAIRVEAENKSLLRRILDASVSVNLKEMRESYKKVV